MADVYRAARTASLAASSGHAVGTVTRDGTTLGIDVEGEANGSNQTVFITTPDGGTAEVLTVGDGYWVGGDEAYWTESTGDAKRARTLVGKYAPITESDATELGSFTLRTLLTDAFALPELPCSSPTPAPRPPPRSTGARRTCSVEPAAPACGWPPTAVAPCCAWWAPRGDPSDLTFSDWERATRFTEPPPAQVLED